jgi:GDP-L-fucose synthase
MKDWRGRRVIVTGGAGFLGRAVCDVLRARGVREQDLSVARSARFDLLEAAGARGMMAAHPACDVVIHCAGLVGGLGLNRQHPAAMFHDNLMMMLNVGWACVGDGLAARGGKLVLIGSMTSYPAGAPLPYREEDLFNGLPDAEIASYGVAKLAGLQMLRAMALEHGLKSACAVLVNLYGPGDNLDDERKSHAAGALIKRFTDAADRGLEEVVCWGTGAPTRDFLFIDDAAEGVVRVAEEVEDASAVNLASGAETSIKSLTELIARACGYRGRVVWDAGKGDGVSRRCLDIARARARLGWSPRIGLEEGLSRTVAWYRTRRG